MRLRKMGVQIANINFKYNSLNLFTKDTEQIILIKRIEKKKVKIRIPRHSI